MKTWMRLLVILALAVGLGIFARTNSGYVQIAMPEWFSLEWSLNFFVLTLLVAFVLFYAVLQAGAALWRLPQRWRQRGEEKRRRRLLQRQNALLQTFWREDFDAAQKEAAALLDAPETASIAALIGGRAALRGGDPEDAGRFLRHAGLAIPEYRVPRILLEAEALLRRQRAGEALQLLQQLRAEEGLHRDAARLELQALAASGRRSELTALLDTLQQKQLLCTDEINGWRLMTAADPPTTDSGTISDGTAGARAE